MEPRNSPARQLAAFLIFTLAVISALGFGGGIILARAFPEGEGQSSGHVELASTALALAPLAAFWNSLFAPLPPAVSVTIPHPFAPRQTPIIATTTIIQEIQQPVIEHVVTDQAAPVDAVSHSDLAIALAALKGDLQSELSAAIGGKPSSSNAYAGNSLDAPVTIIPFAQSQRIDQLSGTVLTDVTMHGVSGLTDADIPDDITASNYLPLSGGTIEGDLTVTGSIYNSATSSSATDFTTVNLAATNASATNATTTNLFASDASITSATSTSLFAAAFYALSGAVESLSATLASIGSLTATNLVAVNATTTKPPPPISPPRMRRSRTSSRQTARRPTPPRPTSSRRSGISPAPSPIPFLAIPSPIPAPPSPTPRPPTAMRMAASLSAAPRRPSSAATERQALSPTRARPRSPSLAVLLPGVAAPSLLALDAAHRITATTTIDTGVLSGMLGTINGMPLSAGSSITVTAASSTLLVDTNTFSGADAFTNPASSFAGAWQGYTPSHFQPAGTYLTALGNGGLSSTTNAIEVEGSTNEDIWLNFRKSGTTPAGNAGIVLSDFSNNHFFLSDNGNLSIDYSGQSSDSPSIASAMNVLTIEPTGKVGIGTTGPKVPLQVESYNTGISFAPNMRTAAIFEGSGAGTTVDLVSPSGGQSEIWFALPNNETRGRIRYDFGSDALEFYTASTEQVVVALNGDVGIGTTSPSTKLQVAGDIAPALASSYNLGTATYNFGCLYYNGDTLGTCASDERLKADIQALDFDQGSTTALQQLAGLHPRSFAYKTATSTLYDGLIAQEVQAVAPELVTTDASSGMMEVRYGDLQWLMLEAMQQLIAKVDALVSEVASLETTMNGFADSFHTNELCVGSTCVTPAQFQAMVAGASQPSIGAGASSGRSTVGPTLTLLGANPAYVALGATYQDLGAAAEDAQGHDLSIHLTLDGTTTDKIAIDTSVATTHTIIYTAIDGAGRTASTTRSVIVGDATGTDATTATTTEATTIDETAASTPVDAGDTVATSTAATLTDSANAASATSSPEAEIASSTEATSSAMATQ